MDLAILGEALSEKSTPDVRERALALYQKLSSSTNGWKSFSCLTENSYFFEINSQLQFATLVFLHDHVKKHFDGCNEIEQAEFRQFSQKILVEFGNKVNLSSKLITSKFASFLSVLCVHDYPANWKTFFHDIMFLKERGLKGIELYLMILKEVNCELSDRQIARTDEEFKRNTFIKDTMRDDCVSLMADSWKGILKLALSNEGVFNLDNDDNSASTVSLCLEVMAGYIQWIEIAEMVNDEVVGLLLSLSFKKGTRKAAIETIDAVCAKGMLPDSKMPMIDSFYSVLNGQQILDISRYNPDDEDDVEYLCSLATFVNNSVLQLVDIFKEYSRKDFTISNRALTSIEEKAGMMLQIAIHEDDDVSKAILNSTKELLAIYRQISMTPERKAVTQQIMLALVKKYKFEPDFNFDNAQEDENDFHVFRHELRYLFDSLAKLDNMLVTEFVQNCFMSTIPNWRSRSFDEVELSLHLFYLLGESLPHVSGNIFTTESPATTIVVSLLHTLVASEVSQFDHPAVMMIYFEIVVRYDKFFAFNTQHIPSVLDSFTGPSGVLSKYSQVRGRCAYLFCRFIKLLKTSVQPHRDTLLGKIEKIIEQVFVLDYVDSLNPRIDNEDSQFLFEAVGLLIQTCSAESAPVMLASVLRPINQRIGQYADQLIQMSTCDQSTMNQQMKDKANGVARNFSDFVSFASRLSKAFPNSQSVEASGCGPCLVETLEFVLKGLNVRQEMSIGYTSVVYTAVKQYLHRMVICLQSEVILHYVKVTMQSLLQSVGGTGGSGDNTNGSNMCNQMSAGGLIEFIPLVNQVVARYKKQCVEMLDGIFVPVLQVFSMVALSQDPHPTTEPSSQQQLNLVEDEATMTELRSQLKRSFFTFINTILHNEAFPVISGKGQDVVWMVLMSVADGALHFPDPVTQKLCFTILKKFIEVADEASGSAADIRKFTFSNILPACFAVCCAPGFNPRDAQSNMALMEAGGALKFSVEKYGESVVEYISGTYLPSQNIPQEKINELTIAIRTYDAKRFREFYKEWIIKLLG
ncbi:exportin-T-like isoform X2 [Convolutriloba macropyga]|uniref:exportin-T-like isoform X2 n=1 Tax=Convolutriloba macropyga TaxID=536237 RepID=UPI003F51E043